jgi:hypothetical protein
VESISPGGRRLAGCSGGEERGDERRGCVGNGRFWKVRKGLWEEEADERRGRGTCRDLGSTWALTVWACATSVGVPASALLKVRWQHGLQRKQSRPLSGFKPKELRDRED